MNYIMALAGLVMLIIGGELLIRGAMSAANKLNVSPFLSGLVIVGFGTSIPELIVSVNAIVNNNPAIALGNVMGSNIGNIGLIIGTCGLLAPLVFNQEKHHNSASHKLHQNEGKELDSKPHKTCLLVFAIFLGLGLLMLGAQWFVTGATIIATQLGVSEALIGLTLVAIGTSLPEFTISVMAVLRKHMDVAIGNVIGSNIFNILGILGISALISPMPFTGRFALFDQWALLIISLILTLFLMFGHSISKIKSMLLLVFYIVYIALGYIYFN